MVCRWTKRRRQYLVGNLGLQLSEPSGPGCRFRRDAADVSLCDCEAMPCSLGWPAHRRFNGCPRARCLLMRMLLPGWPLASSVPPAEFVAGSRKRSFAGLIDSC